MQLLRDVANTYYLDADRFARFMAYKHPEFLVATGDEIGIEPESLVPDLIAEFDAFKEIEQAQEEKNEFSFMLENEENAKKERARVKSELRQAAVQDILVFDLVGCRGRKMRVYQNRCVITTDITLGSVLTANATDGEKTIFFCDVVGVQFKAAGVLIGYLQLETASGQMNNLKDNMFSENTFTFDGICGNTNTELMREVKDYILYQIERTKVGSRFS